MKIEKIFEFSLKKPWKFWFEKIWEIVFLINNLTSRVKITSITKMTSTVVISLEKHKIIKIEKI